MRGLITRRAGAKVEVWVEEKGQFLNGVLRGRLRLDDSGVFAGDLVEGEVISENEFAVETVLERRNLLPKPRVANVDKLVIVVSWREPDFSNLTVDGLIVLATYFGLGTVIVINKSDLVRTKQRAKFESWVKLYSGLNYEVIPTSVKTGEGIDRLVETLSGQIVVLAGPSGVGKSSLLNVIIPGAQLRVGEVSEKTRRGKHTTTEVRLLQNPKGGWVADTPGFQKVDMPEWITPKELGWFYEEFYTVRCQFNDCSHTVEPGCTVREAVKKGEISQTRYNSYLFWLDVLKKSHEKPR